MAVKIVEVKPKDTDRVFNVDGNTEVVKVFLAGTIDGGISDNWQKLFIESVMGQYDKLADGNENGYVVFYNPRRDDWPDSESEMNYQVNWELNHLEEADIIYMNILADSKSPITLLELGLFARSGKLYVNCPKEFYRYDNVRIVCEKYGIPLRNSEKDEWMNN